MGSYRYDRAELDRLIKEAPETSFPWPDSEEMAALTEAYHEITGQQIHGFQYRFLRACAALHGPDTVPMLRDLWRLAPTTTNLLADLRVNTPRGSMTATTPPVLTVVSKPEPAGHTRAATGDWDLDDIPEGIIDPADRTHRPDSVPCNDYRGHQLRHRYLGDGRWTCDACADVAAA